MVDQMRSDRRRRALVMTETELKLIAARGDHRAEQQAEERIQTPAAIGTPSAL